MLAKNRSQKERECNENHHPKSTPYKIVAHKVRLTQTKGFKVHNQTYTISMPSVLSTPTSPPHPLRYLVDDSEDYAIPASYLGGQSATPGTQPLPQAVGLHSHSRGEVIQKPLLNKKKSSGARAYCMTAQCVDGMPEKIMYAWRIELERGIGGDKKPRRGEQSRLCSNGRVGWRGVDHCVFQLERGKGEGDDFDDVLPSSYDPVSSGRLHMQLTLELLDQRDWATIQPFKRWMAEWKGCMTWKTRYAKSNKERACGYCSKPNVAFPDDTTAVGHPFCMGWERLPDYLCVDIKTDGYPWQLELLDRISIDARTISNREIMHFFNRRGNVGKSEFARYCRINKPGTIIVSSGKRSDIFFAIHQMEHPNPDRDRRGRPIPVRGVRCNLIICDMPRDMKGLTPIGTFESVKSGNFFSGKYESKDCVMNNTHVVCFSNFPVLERDSLSHDRWLTRCIFNGVFCVEVEVTAPDCEGQFCTTIVHEDAALPDLMPTRRHSSRPLRRIENYDPLTEELSITYER